MIHLVWEFRVKPGCEREFESRYGAGGAWERLFQRGSGYQGTVLLRDTGEPRRYLLSDQWCDLASFEAFRRDFAPEYETLDRECESLTTEERLLGRFQR